jgi:rfaE bifunctional protein nucleotidyltransferase chain/domain
MNVVTTAPNSAPDSAPDFEIKMLTLPLLLTQRGQLKTPIVLTNGVFDLLHRGHVTYLAQARALGGSLVVAINTDASVRRLGKGSNRPINTASNRAAVLSALACVDAVIEFDEDTAEAVVAAVQPDIYVKGGDYTVDTLPEAKIVATYGGRTEVIAFLHDTSTTKIINKLQR